MTTTTSADISLQASLNGKETEMFSETMRTCFEREVASRLNDFEAAGADRPIWHKAAECGLLGTLLRKIYANTLTDVGASMAKIWQIELKGRTPDACGQLGRGAGWMEESSISRMITAALAQRIYAEATELTKDLLGRRYTKEALTGGCPAQISFRLCC